MTRLVVIVGPTAAGKSDLAVAMAKQAGVDIISADSQQVYRGLDIGTGKLAASERDGVAHHLIDIASPQDEMTAARFARLADEVIDSKPDAGWVIAGGTMLYVRALLYGLFEGPAADDELRERLRQLEDAEGKQALHNRLRQLDPKSAEAIAATDSRRMIRAIEVSELTGQPFSQWLKTHEFGNVPARYDYVQIGIAPPRDVLYKRINKRVEKMMERGWLQEVQALRQAGCDPSRHRSQRAIGYQQLHQVLDNDLELDEAVRLIQRNSRRYARRQVSWYRGDGITRWFSDASKIDLQPLGRYLRGEIDRRQLNIESLGARDPGF